MSGATPVSSGTGTSSVFSVPLVSPIISSYIDGAGVTQQKSFFGRVRAIDTSGNIGNWSPIEKTSTSTPLIDSQYIVSLTASRITAGTIGAHEIILTQPGAQTSYTPPSNMAVLRSSNYAQGNAGWLIRGDGLAEFNNLTVRTQLDIGGDDNTSFHVDANGNMWVGAGISNFSTAPFRITNTGALTATNANITGAINATSGTFAGSLSSASGTFTGALSGGTISIGSGNSIFKADANGIYLGNATFSSAPFRVSVSGALTATNATISGTISGSLITGSRLEAGSGSGFAYVGDLGNISSGHYGISLDTSFTNIFLKRNDGAVFFRVDNGVHYIKYENGSIYIKGNGIEITPSGASFSGSITGATGTFSGSITGATGQFSGDIVGGQGEFVYEDASQATLRVIRRTGASYANTIVALIWRRPSDGTDVRIGNLRWLAAEQNSFSTTPTWIFGEGIRAEQATTTSDMRLKNITNKEIDALQILKKLKTTEFSWKDTEDARKYGDPNKKEYGYIAQQVHEIIPEATVIGNDELDENGKLISKWYVLDSKLTPYLVRSIQQLCDRIEYLESKLSE